MPDGTDPAEVTTKTLVPTVERFEAAGVGQKTAYQYVRILATAAELLGAVGQDVLTCDDAGVCLLARKVPPSRQAMLRSALNRVWALDGRAGAPSLAGLRIARRNPEPASREVTTTSAFEVRQLMGELASAGYTLAWVAKRLDVPRDALRARGERVDARLADRVAALAAHLVPRQRRGPARRLSSPAVDQRFDVAALMATGLSRKTAYTYSRVLAKVRVVLAERGEDLATCSAGDLAAVAEAFPNSRAMRSCVRAAIGRAWEILDRVDPPSLRAVRVPPRPRAKSRALPHEVAVKLERAAWARGDRLGLAVLIGLYAALRRAEISRLRWEDFVIDDDGTGWIRVMGKGDVLGEVPLHPVLQELIEQLRPKARSPWLFPGRWRDAPVAECTIWEWTKRVAREAGLARFTTHLLRHTSLTEANDSSHDLRGVQEFARHSRPDITAIYTRVTHRQLLEVVSTIDYGRSVSAGELLPSSHLVQVLEDVRRLERAEQLLVLAELLQLSPVPGLDLAG